MMKNIFDFDDNLMFWGSFWMLFGSSFELSAYLAVFDRIGPYLAVELGTKWGDICGSTTKYLEKRASACSWGQAQRASERIELSARRVRMGQNALTSNYRQRHEVACGGMCLQVVFL